MRDPQGNILANYERYAESPPQEDEGDSPFLYLTERPIYGSARIGVNMRRVKLSASLANQFDPPARAMQITTVMYDSPSSHKDAPEVHDGEYMVLLNTSNDTLDLGAYRLRNLLTNESWTMSGMGSVAPGQRIMLANYPSGGAAAFKTLSLVTDQALAEGDIRLADSLGISLWDSAGAIVVEDSFGILHSRMNYGEYFGLDARNAYVATASLGNLGGRAPMNAVYRTAGMARPIGGTTPQVWVLTTTGTMAGEVSLAPLPAPYTGSETGTYTQERGGTAYEFTNHLGNVLAVVSDKKLGQGGTTATPIATYYHPETRMLTDYYPFGMAMVGRTWQSGEYRYGFNGMQKDNEIVGEANGYDFGARLYDGRVGRFYSIDPKWENYKWQSSYCFASLSVILLVEIYGGGPGKVTNSSNSTIKLTGSGYLKEACSDKKELIGYIELGPGESFISLGRIYSECGWETRGIIRRSDGLEEFTLISDIDFIDIKPDQTFLLKDDIGNNRLLRDRKGSGGASEFNMGDRKMDGETEWVPNSIVINQEWLKLFPENKEKIVPTPNKGEIKVADFAGDLHFGHPLNLQNGDVLDNIIEVKKSKWFNNNNFLKVEGIQEFDPLGEEGAR